MDELRQKAQDALEQLWARANDEQTPAADRVKLLQYFVALGVGTPRQMADRDSEGDAAGVVLLPELSVGDTDLTV